jgi:2,5-diketo-D-gluconate reductase A
VVCDEASSKRVPCFPLAGEKKVPQVAMGSWSGSYKDCVPTDYTCVEQHARFAVETWLHLGGTHVDTANDYRTQTSIATALANTPGYKREEVFLTTKCPGAIGYQGIIQCADDNLQMLGQFTEQGPGYIDLLLVHFPFTVKPMCRFNRAAPECQGSAVTPASKEELQDTWRGMEELKRIGVVRSIGISDYHVDQIKQTLETAKEPIELNQVEWNPAHHDESMLAFCKEHNIQLQAWSPLGGASGSVLSHPVVKGIAAKHNVSTAQVTLRWSLQRGVAVVVGTADPAHAKGDIELFGFELDDEEVTSISALQSGHPAILMA